jgi:hypothetical protein
MGRDPRGPLSLFIALGENSPVPINKRYAEMAPQEQNGLKSQYEKMGPNDEPPFPVNGLANLYKTMIKGAEKFQVEGQLILFVDIDAQGKATSVSVVRSPDPEMTQFAAGILIFERYKPAVCDGTPCKMQFPFRINFTRRL